MRATAALLILLCPAVLPAQAQAPAGEGAPAPKQGAPAPKQAPAPKKPNTAIEAYAKLTPAERQAIQADLQWAGHYAGTIGTEIGDRAINGVKAFQKAQGGKETGILTPAERTALANTSRAKQSAVGWRMIDDLITGVRLGLPGKLVPQVVPSPAQSIWRSAKGEVQVEAFRLTDPAQTLAALFEKEKAAQPGRKINYNVLRADFFVVSGLQGLKKFYVRAASGGGEIRGLRIQYDQSMEGTMDPVVLVMSNTFAAFPAGAAALPRPRPKVEYASGIVLNSGGEILTARDVTQDCHLITIAGFGPADRVAEAENGLALVRVYGARGLKPVALGTGAAAGDTTLIGIADPQAQGGDGKVSTLAAKVSAAGQTLQVEPAPPPGFLGGAAIGRDGRLQALLLSRNLEVAGPAGAGGATLVPAAAIKAFLAEHGVTASDEPGGSADAAKDGVVRLICVRK